MSVVLAKIAIALILSVIVLIVWYNRNRLKNILKKQSTLTTLAGYGVVFRLIPYVLVFLILGIEPTSDVNGFWDMAYNAADGKVVYRDFWSPYSPLYSYYLGMWTYLWHHPKVIVLAMVFTESIAVWISYGFFSKTLQKGELLFRTLVYYLLPGSLVLCVLGAQEDIWMWLFIALAVVIKRRTNSTIAFSFVLAIGVLFTKVIFVLFLLPLVLITKNKWEFMWPIALVGLITLAILYPLVGLEFLQPIGEADTIRSPNILTVINPWTWNTVGLGVSLWNWIGLVITISVGSFVALKSAELADEARICYAFSAMYATLMIVQQSAYSNYIFIFLIPLVYHCMNLDNQKEVILLLVYNFICVVHPSYWWRLGMPKYLSPTDIFAQNNYIIDYCLQVTIIVFTLFLIYYLIIKSKRSRSDQNQNSIGIFP